MNKFYCLQLGGLARGRLLPWWGEAANVREAIIAAEADNPGLKVSYGTEVTEAQYTERDVYA
jgi:hypothetical protein